MYTTSEPCEFQQPTVAYMYETKRQLLSLKVSLAHTHNSDRQPIVVILNAKKTSREALKDCNKNNVIHAPYIKPFIYHTCHTLVFFTIYDSSHIQLKPKVFPLTHMKNSALIPLPVQKQFALTFFFVLVL